MEALITRVILRTTVGRFVLLAGLLLVSMGASVRTPNFIVETDDPAFAQQMSQAAEKYRRELAVSWLGQAMPNWYQPCVMTVQAAPHLGAGGATTFQFQDGEVFGWRMSIQGSRERLLDSVLPHEITHMIFASHFRRPLPRWADEGGATSVESAVERNKYRQMLMTFLRSGRGIAFNQMFAIMEYPPDYMPLYAQGYSLAEFLIQSAGRQKYVKFLDDGMKNDDWCGAAARHYSVKDLGALQNNWLAWVKQGAPLAKPGEPRPATLLADARRPRPEPNLIYRDRPQEPPPMLTAAMTAIPGPVNDRTALPAATANVPRSEPTSLPASGWRAAAETASIYARTPSTQAAHPQPMEQPLGAKQLPASAQAAEVTVERRT
ncbi:MAG: hypothetical protein WCB27_18610 [Thermoguttaceae bacterium]